MSNVNPEDVKNLEKLDISFQLDHLLLEAEWFRAVYAAEVPNPEWHFHKNVEIHYLHEGSIAFQFEGDRILLRPGQVIVIGPYVSHQLINETGQRHLRFVLNVSLTRLQEDPEAAFIQAAFERKAPAVFLLPQEIQALFIECLQEATEKVSGYLSIIKLNLMRILWEIARSLSQSPKAEYSVSQKYSLDDRRSFTISEYIENTPPDQLFVSSIAKYMNLSEKQVQRIVKRQFGVTVKRLISDVKLKKAKELLKDPSYSIRQISNILGFANEQYFNRFFKQNEGMPPGKYRKSIEPSSVSPSKRKK
jgi:AraC-like DNA-binding protein/mannose-6-phosphate isomerase-like protein (cupin superfamily)